MILMVVRMFAEIHLGQEFPSYCSKSCSIVARQKVLRMTQTSLFGVCPRRVSWGPCDLI